MKPAGDGGRAANARGMSVIEVLVAITIFSVAALGLTKIGLTTSRALQSGRGHMTEWTIAQSTLDSLRGLGWAALDGETGSATVQGHTVTWEVQGDNPRHVIVVIPRQVLGRTVSDTFTTYVANQP